MQFQEFRNIWLIFMYSTKNILKNDRKSREINEEILFLESYFFSVCEET